MKKTSEINFTSISFRLVFGGFSVIIVGGGWEISGGSNI
jgi:hypothetical protein